MNPVPDAQGLRLNISEADNSLDLDLAFRPRLTFASMQVRRARSSSEAKP